VIVAMLPDPAALAIKAYREAGYSIPLLSNNSFRRDYQLKALGALANGVEGSSVTQVDKGPSGQAFVAAFFGGDRRDAGDDVVGRL
jgi:ABC-type branched-subunit amino acid transport system substrate-binding protein